MGLKDQRLALQWVKAYISNFGGDSNSITLFGQSAGSSSAHMHLLLSESAGLFNRVLMLSGTVLSPWAYSSKTDQLDVLYAYGKIYIYYIYSNIFLLFIYRFFVAKSKGKAIRGVEKLKDFLLKADPIDLTAATAQPFFTPGSSFVGVDLTWAPVVEGISIE